MEDQTLVNPVLKQQNEHAHNIKCWNPSRES